MAVEDKQYYAKTFCNITGSTESVSGLTETVGGSMVDDGQWHDIIIIRQKKNVKFVVDRLETIVETNGLFFKLDLDKMVSRHNCF